jgi:hypothetical protein
VTLNHDLAAASWREGEIPAFAGMTKRGAIASPKGRG